jgi:hypothetical protein
MADSAGAVAGERLQPKASVVALARTLVGEGDPGQPFSEDLPVGMVHCLMILFSVANLA